MEYDVPRSLDVPDRMGIPGFSTMQFAVLLAGLALMAGAWKLLEPYNLPLTAKVFVVYIPLAALLLPRSLGRSGWTSYRMIVARVGRWCRPRRALWRPE